MIPLIHKFVCNVFPRVNIELSYWETYAKSLPCPELRKQALASIKDKRFHCQGGNIYSLFQGVPSKDFIKLVVALQTISDYLDNLCDRAGIADEAAFRQLHLAMTDALDPVASLQDYYRFYPLKNDGGYLTTLVTTCQDQLKTFPSYPLIKKDLLHFACLYSDLQTYKHLDLSIREKKMNDWLGKHTKSCPYISNWELAAATGSTLGMFMLCAAASDKSLTAKEVSEISAVYFPWISGLHILLDYFIDEREDAKNGDLNFLTYYTDEKEITSRLCLFTKQALLQAQALPHPSFHRIVVQGLLAMYLSDPKIHHPKEQRIKNILLRTAGGSTRLLYGLCKLLRFAKKL